LDHAFISVTTLTIARIHRSHSIDNQSVAQITNGRGKLDQ